MSMSMSEFTCICLGILSNVATFFLGTAVGVTIAQNKDATASSRDGRGHG